MSRLVVVRRPLAGGRHHTTRIRASKSQLACFESPNCVLRLGEYARNVGRRAAPLEMADRPLLLPFAIVKLLECSRRRRQASSGMHVEYWRALDTKMRCSRSSDCSRLERDDTWAIGSKAKNRARFYDRRCR